MNREKAIRSEAEGFPPPSGAGGRPKAIRSQSPRQTDEPTLEARQAASNPMRSKSTTQ
jgi:hypothetical protein